MPKLTKSARAKVRKALEAEGYSEAQIRFVLRAADNPHNDDPEQFGADGWTRQLRSTLPSRGGHL
jgi:hypothetical protein